MRLPRINSSFSDFWFRVENKNNHTSDDLVILRKKIAYKGKYFYR